MTTPASSPMVLLLILLIHSPPVGKTCPRIYLRRRTPTGEEDAPGVFICDIAAAHAILLPIAPQRAPTGEEDAP